jgi:uncharacterized protein (DUF849 family)
MHDNRFIINVCLTGMIPIKQHNRHVPMTPTEIARDVEQCMEHGASIFHIHARDKQQKPEWRSKAYEQIFKAIRRVSKEAIICASTSGRAVADVEKRADCLNAEPTPDMASLTLGSLNFSKDASINSPATITGLIELMNKRGVKPELEIFDIGMARTAARLIEEGVFRAPVYANILLGNRASADASLLDLGMIANYLPKHMLWCAAGIGKSQLSANLLGLLFGHGVRVGLEDNLYLDDKKTLATNTQLVKRVQQIAKQLGKKPYTPQEVRKLLGLKT